MADSVISWTRLTSFDLQGSVPKETKSWPQSKVTEVTEVMKFERPKSFVLSLDIFGSFTIFTDVSTHHFQSLWILGVSKAKKIRLLLHCSCKSVACILLSTHSLT